MKLWKKWTLAFVIVASVAAVSYMYTISKKPKGIDVRTAGVKRGDLSVYLSSSGAVESKNKKDYFVYSPVKVEKVYVRVGDKVTVGELLLKLEAPNLSTQLKQAYIQLDIARTTLENMKKQKETTVKSPSLSVPSGSIPEGGTPGKNVIGDSMFEGGMAAVSIDDQISLQEKQVEIAKLNVESIKDKMRNVQSQVNSDISGIVTAVNVVEGGIANPGMPVATVEDINDMKAVLNVSQYDALKVKTGQEASIKLGGGEKKYKGVVDRINPTAKKVIMGISQETGIPVDVTIINPDNDMRIGFDVDVEVMTASKTNALYIPYEAVITDKNGNDRVFTVEGESAVLKNIKTGIESDFYVEVVSGLSEGENVILNPPTELKDGSTVTIKSDGEGS